MMPPVASLEAPLQGGLQLKGYHQEGQTAANYDIQASLTKKGFYTQKLLHTEAFTHRSFYTQGLLHTEAFTHRGFYTQGLLHTEGKTAANYDIQASLMIPFRFWKEISAV